MNEINCRFCIAACCGPDVSLKLTDAEAEFLAAAGTALVQDIRPLPVELLLFDSTGSAHIDFEDDAAHLIPAYHGVYRLVSQCGHVENQRDFPYTCGVYNNPGRPKVCEEFPVGGKTCQKIRLSRGVDK